MLITGAKANDGKYILLFEENHADCTHEKHVANILDYTFIFCKASKNPVAIYCGAEVVEDDDVINLIGELAEKYSIVTGVIESPYFTSLSKALLDVDAIRLTG